MKFVLFCEGNTEKKSLPTFLKRWLDPQLSQPVGIAPVRFQGWRELYDEVKKKAHLRLREGNVIAVISLMDLYGPTFYPENVTTAGERYNWGKEYIERIVGNERFHQFFAVHEVEAWLLSDPRLFPTDVSKALPGTVRDPETVNFNQPPAKLLDRLYREKTKRNYKKVVYGRKLFGQLDPNTASIKCPHLKEMLEKMLDLARKAGL